MSLPNRVWTAPRAAAAMAAGIVVSSGEDDSGSGRWSRFGSDNGVNGGAAGFDIVVPGDENNATAGPSSNSPWRRKPADEGDANRVGSGGSPADASPVERGSLATKSSSDFGFATVRFTLAPVDVAPTTGPEDIVSPAAADTDSPAAVVSSARDASARAAAAVASVGPAEVVSTPEHDEVAADADNSASSDLRSVAPGAVVSDKNAKENHDVVSADTGEVDTVHGQELSEDDDGHVGVAEGEPEQGISVISLEAQAFLSGDGGDDDEDGSEGGGRIDRQAAEGDARNDVMATSTTPSSLNEYEQQQQQQPPQQQHPAPSPADEATTPTRDDNAISPAGSATTAAATFPCTLMVDAIPDTASPAPSPAVSPEDIQQSSSIEEHGNNGDNADVAVSPVLVAADPAAATPTSTKSGSALTLSKSLTVSLMSADRRPSSRRSRGAGGIGLFFKSKTPTEPSPAVLARTAEILSGERKGGLAALEEQVSNLSACVGGAGSTEPVGSASKYFYGGSCLW